MREDARDRASDQVEEEGEDVAKVFETAGGYAPTIGIIGAVLGLIQVMSHLSAKSTRSAKASRPRSSPPSTAWASPTSFPPLGGQSSCAAAKGSPSRRSCSPAPSPSRKA